MRSNFFIRLHGNARSKIASSAGQSNRTSLDFEHNIYIIEIVIDYRKKTKSLPIHFWSYLSKCAQVKKTNNNLNSKLSHKIFY